MRILSNADLTAMLDLPDLLEVVADGFRAQAQSSVERPPRPHFPVGQGVSDGDGIPAKEPLGTGLVMAAYVHGAPYYVTKTLGVHERNTERGLPTVHASITLMAADTGRPVGTMDGSLITNVRTGCIGGLAARELATAEPHTVGVLGAGTQARWQVRAIDAAVDVDTVRVYSPSGSRDDCATALREFGINANAVGSPAAAVRDASVVVTATTATEPVFDGDDLAAGVLVVAVGA